MKVGDLVTLSEYAIGLEPLWYITQSARSGKVCGLLINISESDKPWDSGTWYQVRWVNPEHKKLCRSRWAKPGLFRRKDLKMYKKPKIIGDYNGNR